MHPLAHDMDDMDDHESHYSSHQKASDAIVRLSSRPAYSCSVFCSKAYICDWATVVLFIVATQVFFRYLGLKPYVRGLYRTALDTHPLKDVWIDREWRSRPAPVAAGCLIL